MQGVFRVVGRLRGTVAGPDACARSHRRAAPRRRTVPSAGHRRRVGWPSSARSARMWEAGLPRTSPSTACPRASTACSPALRAVASRGREPQVRTDWRWSWRSPVTDAASLSYLKSRPVFLVELVDPTAPAVGTPVPAAVPARLAPAPTRGTPRTSRPVPRRSSRPGPAARAARHLARCARGLLVALRDEDAKRMALGVPVDTEALLVIGIRPVPVADQTAAEGEHALVLVVQLLQ